MNGTTVIRPSPRDSSGCSPGLEQPGNLRTIRRDLRSPPVIVYNYPRSARIRKGDLVMAIPVGRSRRGFLSTVGLTTAGLTIVPRHVLGRGFQAPSDRLNIAVVGVGGRGCAVITNMVSENLVAMCDVDWGYADRGFADLDTEISKLETRIAGNYVEVRVPASARNEGAPPTITTRPMTPLERTRAIALAGRQKALVIAAPKAARHQDFRRMLDQQKDIDAVVVATPDHLHAGIALAAMDLGKHVYVEKPLCWSVAEARQLAKRAAETKVATQMGNQGHSLDDGRMAVEYLQAGAIGDVTEVHVWTNRPLGFWPQGVPRPAPRTTAGRRAALERARDHGAPRRRDGRPLPDARRPGLGSVPRSGAVRRVSPGVPPVQLARLGRLGRRARSATWARI